MKRRHWHYNGDVNIEHGGFFYDLSTFEQGYVDVVRVVPCSDAGGPDNYFWLQKLNAVIYSTRPFAGKGDTIEMRRAHRALHQEQYTDERDIRNIEEALKCIGYDNPQMLADWDKHTVAERRHIILYACVSYGHYDVQGIDGQVMLRIGPKDPDYDEHARGAFTPDKILRANASLRNYARRQCDSM